MTTWNLDTYCTYSKKMDYQAFSSRRIESGEKLTVNRHKLSSMPYAINKLKPNSYVVVKQPTLTEEEELEKAKEFPWIAKVHKAQRSLEEVELVKFGPKELILGYDHTQEMSTDTVDGMVDVINKEPIENQNKWWCMKIYNSFNKLSFISQ